MLWELTEGKLGEAPAPPVSEGTSANVSVPASLELSDDEKEEVDEMESRLAALKST